MKHLERLKTGLSVVNSIWFTFIFIRLIQIPVTVLPRVWVWLILVVISLLVSAYSIGEVIELIENIYLRGKYIGKVKVTINNENSPKNGH